ncbi:MAG TPA: isopeptide-forming domain-containing fimbrial protein, partial [Roseiflexaceae bacterium]|nr:isopeptide-forming domain-containing fimbrial protein [Roseiflexaceae bacterium]
APFAAANYTVFLNADNNPATPATDGSTTMTFRVSNELITRGQDGRLVGGCVPPAGTGAAPPYCTSTTPPATVNDGGTTGRIVYRTIIQEFFSDTYPSGDPSVDQGDLLTNRARIDGRVLGNADATTPTGFFEDDDTAAAFEIVRGTLAKTVYAVGGVVCNPQPCTGVRAAPGETITYRLVLTLPSSDVEDLRLVDYLPLPVFNATEVSTTFNNVVSAAPPPAGQAKFGPIDTFSTIFPGGVPTISVTGPGDNNTVTFFYGSYDDTSNRFSTIDILFTVTLTDDPFADGLFLTNQVRQTESSTNQGGAFADAIVQIRLMQPNLNIRKSAVAASTGTFAPAPLPGGVSISAPGTTACPRITGTITSANIDTAFDSVLTGVDAGDRVTFAILVENTGSSPNGAFDVRIRDTLPTGFVIPTDASGLNLCVTDGTGALMPFTALGSGLFDPAGGIEFNDPGPTSPPTGALDPGIDINDQPINTGRNIAVVTFDLIVDQVATPDQSLINTATLFNYAGAEGAPDHTTEDRIDTATVDTAPVTLQKTRIATSEAHTSGANVTIGEIIRYRIAAQLPEGTTNNFQIREILPTGLTFLNDGSARFAYLADGPGISSATVAGIPAAPCANTAGTFTLAQASNPAVLTSATIACTFADANISNSETANTDVYNSGTDVSFKFGTLQNQDRDANAEFVIVELNVLVDNTAAGSNDAGDTRVNRAQARQVPPGETALVNVGAEIFSATEFIVEPFIPFNTATNNKTVDPESADAGDTVNYAITFAAASGANRSTAFDVRVIDVIPAAIILNPASLAVSSVGNCATGLSGAVIAGPAIEILVDVLPLDCRVNVTYSGTLVTNVSPAQEITNTANITYTSLPGTGTVGNPTGSNTPGASGAGNGERDGSGGGINDYNGSDPAIVTVFSPAPVKTLIASSEAHTSGTDVAIGEIVRYRVVARLAESTSINFQLSDNLPDGLQYLNDGTTRVAFVANEAGITSSTIAGPGLSFVGNETTIDTITPTFLMPAGAISGGPFTSGVDPVFSFGDVVNGDTDTDLEFLVIEFNALVLNVSGNQDGTILGNTVSVLVNNNLVATSASADITVVEPDLPIDKSVVTPPVDAGDPVTYEVSFTNSGSTDAFDLTFADLLPTGLTLDTGFTPQITLTGGATGATPTISGNQLTVTLAQAPVGGGAIVRYRATVDASVEAGQTITNTAT